MIWFTIGTKVCSTSKWIIKYILFILSTLLSSLMLRNILEDRIFLTEADFPDHVTYHSGRVFRKSGQFVNRLNCIRCHTMQIGSNKRYVLKILSKHIFCTREEIYQKRLFHNINPTSVGGQRPKPKTVVCGLGRQGQGEGWRDKRGLFPKNISLWLIAQMTETLDWTAVDFWLYLTIII